MRNLWLQKATAVLCGLLLWAGLAFIPAQASAWEWKWGMSDWRTRDKVLMATYTVGNVIDIMQTGEAISNPAFEEANPLLNGDHYLPMMVGLNLVAPLLLNNIDDPGMRTGVLYLFNATKWLVVYNNHSIGIQIGF